MSTAELYLTEEEIAEFITETRTETQYFYGEEGQEYGVCPYITFYVYHGKEDFLPLCHEVIELHQELQTLIDSPYKKSTTARHKLGQSHAGETGAPRCCSNMPSWPQTMVSSHLGFAPQTWKVPRLLLDGRSMHSLIMYPKCTTAL